MPANLTPEYKTAEAAFKRASEPKDRLELLRTMLRALPKHKGTDHLQAEIKTRIKELTEELAGPKKGGARRGPPTSFRAEGAAQLALIGPPNSGKSTLHARLTGSHAQTGEYPFTTLFAQPGMMPYQDIHFQLIDLPPISAEHPIPWIGNALQPADACLLVVDLCEAGCMERAVAVRDILAERKIVLSAGWPGDSAAPRLAAEHQGDPFTIHLPTLLIVNKTDLVNDPKTEIGIFEDLTDLRYPWFAVSATTGEGLDQIGPWIFTRLGIIRVYSKAPGKPPDMERPYTIRRAGTVHDVAELVHRDIAESLKFARLWRTGVYEGQHVGGEHTLVDGDVVELHA
ncbi:MAG: 50S ribosome-binding GTPase [Acidimicrobiia bacterium]|nr:50S ribosome-binding GTPase [Acidimicrobiia bacterium]MDH3396785.1 50S ribosome-binding GTPase [Acidimicrobiia bacterium]